MHRQTQRIRLIRKADMKNKRTIIRALLCVVLAFCAIFSCACTKSYKKYRKEENLCKKATVEKHSFEAYFFLLPEGNAVLQLTDEKNDSKVHQTFEFPAEGEFYTSLDFSFAFDGLSFQDMNFDGKLDLYVPCSVTTPNLEGMAWLWDSEKDTFVLSKELSALYELTVFPDEKLITSQDYTAPDGILCREFVWENGKLLQTGEYTINN